MAGTIAQATNNGEGVAGVAFEATLMPVKVLNHFGSGTSADIADAIRCAADHGAKVINMSLGGGGHSRGDGHAVAYARKKGVDGGGAAGNAGRGARGVPRGLPGRGGRGARWGRTGTRAPYSSYGKELDIAAPGGDKRQGDEGGILQNTIDPRDASRSVYASYQGTSMATPHVAAVAALLYAAGAKSPDEVEKALFAGAKRVGGQAWTEQYGHGVLNATRLAGGARRASATVRRTWTAAAGWALALLALVLLTLGRRERPGYLNMLFRPGFLVPLVLATVGSSSSRVVRRRPRARPGTCVNAASLPIPDWQRIIFGRGKLANPLFYSALIPLLALVPRHGFKGLRPVVAAWRSASPASLATRPGPSAPALAWMPFTFLALPWLVFNTVVCLFIARAHAARRRRR